MLRIQVFGQTCLDSETQWGHLRGSRGGWRWAGKGRRVKSRSPAFCPSGGSHIGHCFHGYQLSPWQHWYWYRARWRHPGSLESYQHALLCRVGISSIQGSPSTHEKTQVERDPTPGPRSHSQPVEGSSRTNSVLLPDPIPSCVISLSDLKLMVQWRQPRLDLDYIPGSTIYCLCDLNLNKIFNFTVPLPCWQNEDGSVYLLEFLWKN